MKIRLEFTDRRGSNFPWALRLCKKMPTFQEGVEDGMKVYSVEFDGVTEWRTIEALASYFGHWKRAAWYIDGQLIRLDAILLHVYQAERTRRHLKTGSAEDFINRL